MKWQMLIPVLTFLVFKKKGISYYFEFLNTGNNRDVQT